MLKIRHLEFSYGYVTEVINVDNGVSKLSRLPGTLRPSEARQMLTDLRQLSLQTALETI